MAYCITARVGETVAFIRMYGKRSKPQKCSFCDAKGTKLCDWKTEKQVLIHPSQLRVGDTYVTDGGKNLPILTVQRFKAPAVPHRRGAIVAASWQPGAPEVTVTMFAVNYGNDKYFVFYRLNRSRIPIRREVLCSNPCCANHSRHVGPDTDYCKEHWNSWQEAGR